MKKIENQKINKNYQKETIHEVMKLYHKQSDSSGGTSIEKNLLRRWRETELKKRWRIRNGNRGFFLTALVYVSLTSTYTDSCNRDSIKTGWRQNKWLSPELGLSLKGTCGICFDKAFPEERPAWLFLSWAQLC